jgi:hypothetical protein
MKCDFTRKARFVAVGHVTDTPTQLTSPSVVSQESVCIAFSIVALNEIDILAADIGNTYLQAPCREKYTQLLVWSLGRAVLDRQSSLYAPCMVSSQAVQHGMLNLVRPFTICNSPLAKQTQMCGITLPLRIMALSIMITSLFMWMTF